MTLAASKADKNIRHLQYRTTPYFLIILFSVAVTVLRFFLIPEWTLSTHFILFFVQVGCLTCIWQTVKALNRALDKRMPFRNGPLRRMGLQIFLSLLIVAPLIGGIDYFLLSSDSPIVNMPLFVNKQFIAIAIALFIILIFLFNFGFYAFYFFTNWQQSVEEKAQLQIQTADLEREKSLLQYHQLKNQVNPHFLFNTLTSLDGLIQTDPDLASDFVRHLSKVYRYVLQHKENEVVSIAEELEFIGHYVNLLHIRYREGLRVQIDISPGAQEKGIVMVTLQMLIDNAIKHNVVQPEEPLLIRIFDEEDHLVVQNNRQLRKQIETSNGQGLQQLKQLYSFLSEKEPQVAEAEDYYAIHIPLL